MGVFDEKCAKSVPGNIDFERYFHRRVIFWLKRPFLRGIIYPHKEVASGKISEHISNLDIK